MRFFLCLYLLLLSACGASSLQNSATSATLTKSLLIGTATTSDLFCTEDEVRAADDPTRRAEACLIVAEGYETAIASWQLWVESTLAVAEDEEAVEAARQLAAPSIRFLLETSQLLRESGVDVPEVPEILVRFLEGL